MDPFNLYMFLLFFIITTSIIFTNYKVNYSKKDIKVADNIKKFEIIKYTNFAKNKTIADLQTVLFDEDVIQKFKQDTNIDLNEYKNKSPYVYHLLTSDDKNKDIVILTISETFYNFSLNGFEGVKHINSSESLGTHGFENKLLLHVNLHIDYCQELLNYKKRLDILK